MDISVSTVAGVVKEQLKKMLGAGGSFSDARLYDEGSDEWLFIRDGNAEASVAQKERGIGVRVMTNGSWGFAATADLAAIPTCFAQALANSRASSRLPGFPKDMGPARAFTGKYEPSVAKDPFEEPLAAKLGFLKDLDGQLKADFVAHRAAMSRFQRRRIFYWNSDGTEVDRKQLHSFGWLSVMAPDKDGRAQSRTQELHSNGTGTCGFEWLADADCFGGHVERIKSELALLLQADVLPPTKRDVILLPGMGWLQVHETIGHALELDRILGYELSFAGGSFVRPSDIGKLQYGSPKLTARAGVVENSPGTFGFDDEGTPQRDYLLIDKGVLVNTLSSRTDIAEANAKAGFEAVKESGTAARACAFYRPPIDRMTNINVDPGNDGTLDDIVAATKDGVIFDSATTPSIGSNREHFHFGCEIAWEVKDGERGRVFRNPTYHGHTVPFWSSLDMVGNRSTWRLWPISSCGKGEPNQIMELGHGVPVMRFHGVETGEKE